MRKKYLAVIVASLAVVAALGSSLGLVAAGTRQSVSTGFNLVGGPLQADMPPAQFVACLPATGCRWGLQHINKGQVTDPSWTQSALPSKPVSKERATDPAVEGEPAAL